MYIASAWAHIQKISALSLYFYPFGPNYQSDVSPVSITAITEIVIPDDHSKIPGTKLNIYTPYNFNNTIWKPSENPKRSTIKNVKIVKTSRFFKIYMKNVLKCPETAMIEYPIYSTINSLKKLLNLRIFGYRRFWTFDIFCDIILELFARHT